MENSVLTTDNFVVTDERRAIWRTEMEIAKVLLDFCEEHGLRIWASYGTLLGAVRHKGFIPWDDDMDFYMLREDYDRLYEFSKKVGLFPAPYELVVVDGAIIRLCDWNTTLLNTHYKLDPKRSYGVWVDVMCLDKAPDELNSGTARKLESLRRKVRLINSGKNYCFKSYNGLRFFLSHLYSKLYCFFHGIKSLESFMKEMRTFSDQFSGNKIWNFTEQCKVLPSGRINTYDSEWFSETLMLPFEDMHIPCPKEFEKCLVSEFGEDWRTPIMGTSWHEGAIFDVNTPYKEFINKRIGSLSSWDRFWWSH